VAGALTGGKPASVPRSTPTASGSPIRAVAARPELSAITTAGLPPNDVLASLALPRGARVVPGSALNSGVGLYDHSLGFVAGASEHDVIEFFRAQLPSERWRILSQGPTSSGEGYQVIAQHPASNGYEWEIGVTIRPEAFGTTSPSSTTSAGGTSPGGTTPFTLRLFEVTDEE